MLVKLFVVYDSKTEALLQPFFAQTVAAAVRTCENSCKNPQSGFSANPADYTLFEIAEFDDLNLAVPIKAHQSPVSLGNFIQFMPKDVPSPLGADTLRVA